MQRNKIKLFIICMTLVTTSLVIFNGCDDQGASATYPTSTQFLNVNAARSTDPTLHANTCPTGYVCATPTNLEGRIYYGGLMVGGNGGTGYSVTTLGATAEVRERPDLGKDGSLFFNIATATSISGAYSCCGGPGYPTDAQAIVTRLEFGFDYLDTTFTVPTDEEAGVNVNDDIEGKSFTIRTVYVTNSTVDTTSDGMPSGASTTIYMGDKLVKAITPSRTDYFYWCNATTCDASTRPETAVVVKDTEVADYTPPEQGNDNYYSFGIDLAEPITFTQAEAEQGNWLFKVKFTLTNAAMFSVTTSWEDITSVRDLVNAFKLMARPGSEESSTSVTVALTKEQNTTAEETP